MSNCCNEFEFTSPQGTFYMDGGIRGKDGVTFYPHVSADGILSWTNDGGKQNPDPVDIKGEDGMSAFFVAEYEETTYDEIQTAISEGKYVCAGRSGFPESYIYYPLAGGAQGSDVWGDYNALVFARFDIDALNNKKLYKLTCKKYTLSGSTQWESETLPVELADDVLAPIEQDISDLKSAVDALENNDYNSLAYVFGGEGRIRHDNGLAVAGADYTYTDYLDISKYKSLRYKRVGTTSASGTTGMAFYNAGKSYVSGQQVALSQSQLGYVADLSEVPVPPDAVYARFSMLKNTDTYGTFEVFGYSEPALQFNKIGNDLPVYKGSIANGVFSDSNYNVYIPVSPRSTYKITADSRTVAYGALRSLTIPPVAGTSADYSQATGWTGARSAPPNTTVEGVLPDDANYLYVYYGTAGVSRLPAELKINGIDILDISGSLTENIAILADKVNKLHPKTEKTIAFFGDSIVAGSGVTGEPDSQIFHQYIHDLYGFTCLNYGYGSSGYIRNFTGTGGLMGQGQPGIGVAITTTTKLENSTVLARLQSIQNPTFDAVVIFAGTNDWRHQDEYPYADFLTALENTFTYYQSNYGSIPLLVMTPIKRRGGDVVAEERPKTMSDYRDAIIDMCKKYAVPYVDTMTYSGLNPDNTSNYNLFYMRDDTGELDIVHANHLAHQRIARVVGEVLNQLVLWNSDIVR